MSLEPTQLRALINDRLALLTDPRFERGAPGSPEEGILWTRSMEMLKMLQQEKRPFFASYGYDWTVDRAAYNSPFEAFLQWRLLNTISDVPSDHPDLVRCSNLIVRVLPTSCARPHLREMDQYRVIILTSGYLSAFKGFIRLWLRGCSIGQADPNIRPTEYLKSAEKYIKAIGTDEERMAKSAQAYVGTLLQLLENQVPFMDGESIFDEQVLQRERWGPQFGLLSNAIDGFLLFHEAAHVLAGDSSETCRTMETEIVADRGSVSLCIIDEARSGGQGTVHLGGPMFFCVEILRLLCEEILELKEGRHDLSNGRYPGIDELMLRSSLYSRHILGYLGPVVDAIYREWSDAMGLVFDSVRWALLHSLGTKVPISQFVELPKR